MFQPLPPTSGGAVNASPGRLTQEAADRAMRSEEVELNDILNRVISQCVESGMVAPFLNFVHSLLIVSCSHGHD